MVSKAEIDLLLKAGGVLTRRGVNPNTIRQVIIDPSKLSNYVKNGFMMVGNGSDLKYTGTKLPKYPLTTTTGTNVGRPINTSIYNPYNPTIQPKLLTTSGKPIPDPTFEKGVPVNMYKLKNGYGAYTYKNPKVNANAVDDAINILYKNPKNIAKEVGNIAKSSGGVKGIAGKVGGPLLTTAFGLAPVIANWNAEGSDALTRVQDAIGSLGTLGGTLAGATFGSLRGHPIIGGIVGGYLGDKARELGGGGQVRRDANRSWDTYLTKDQFMRNIQEGRIQLPEGMDVETFYGYYRQAKEGNRPNINKKSTNNTTDNNVNDMYQNPYTSKLDSIENIINNARANGQGYNGELDNQELQDIQSLNTGNGPVDAEGSVTGNIDLNGMLDRYRRQQELQKPYIEGLQNFINNYNDLQRNAFNLDRYFTGLAGWSGNDRWADLGKRYNPITTEATKLDLLNKLAQGQIGIEDIENEMRGNIALAQQAGIDPRVAMANPKLVNALASIENARTSAAARRYVADQNREAKLAGIYSNAMIQKAKQEGNWDLALRLQEMRNDGRLQSAIVNAVSFGADPSIIYNALQGYGGSTTQSNNLQPPKETITTPTGSVEASTASKLLDNTKR
jgi:hypothetical protein